MNVAVLEKREEDALTAMWSAYQRTCAIADKNPTDTLLVSPYVHRLFDVKPEPSIRKSVEGIESSHYWSKLYQTEGSTTTLSIFLPDGTLLGTVEGNGVSTTTYLTHTDHLNSSSVMSDSSGDLSQLATFYPYGALRLDDHPATFDQSRKFLGQHQDRSTELSYLNARYYDGERGGFLSQDPMFLGDPNSQRLANPQELNAYSYAAGNPIVWSDPSGKYSIGTSIVDLHAEAGLSAFFAIKMNLSIHYIKDENSEDSWIAPSITFGASIGYKSKSVSFPEAVENPAAPMDGKPSVFGGSIGAPGSSRSITVSPDVNTPNDLRGVGTDSSLSGPGISLGIQQDQQGKRSFSLDGGVQGPGSISTYPTKTWVPEFAVVGANEIRGVTSKISESYRSGLDRIQTQINYLRQEIAKLGESIRKTTNGK